MIQSPKSLTATIHVKFNYDESEAKPVNESQVEMMNRILGGASELEPALQELLVSFAQYLSEISNDGDKAEPE